MLLLSMMAMTYGKWWLIFDVAAPHHSASMTNWKPTIMSTKGRKNRNSFSQ